MASASRSDKNESLMNKKYCSTHSESMQRQSDPPKNLGADATTISVGGDRNRGTKTRSASIVTAAKKLKQCRLSNPQNPTVSKDTA